MEGWSNNPHGTARPGADRVSPYSYVRRLLALVADGLVEEGRLELRGLGVFAVHVRPRRRTTHPGTGQPITIPEKRAVRYRSSVALRRRLNPPKKRKRSREPAT